MKLLIVILALSSLLPNFAHARFGGRVQSTPAPWSTMEIKNGDTVVIPPFAEGTREVKNPDPLRNTTRRFEYGDRCKPTVGGTFTVIDVKGNDLLLQYAIHGRQTGDACPSGAVFVEFVEGFNRLRWRSHEYEIHRQAEEAQKEEIRRVLKK